MFDTLSINKVGRDFWHIGISMDGNERSYWASTEMMFVFLEEATKILCNKKGEEECE